jgi:hypothetical protein
MVEEGLIYERFLMERLLVHEVEAWEGLVWHRVKEFMGRHDVPESGKEQLMREWRGNCWKRLDTNIHAVDARMERAKAEISSLPSNELQRTLKSVLEAAHDGIRSAWQSVIEQLVDTPTPSASSSSTPGSRFNEDIQERARQVDHNGPYYSPARREQERRLQQEMACRLNKE